jgi:hypothetical protein
MLFKGVTVKEVVLELLKYPNALEYDTKVFSIFSNDLSEEHRIALYLCGISGKQNAITFMNATEEILDSFYVQTDFLTNVKHNSEECIPVILRAINIRLINLAATTPEKLKTYQEKEKSYKNSM